MNRLLMLLMGSLAAWAGCAGGGPDTGSTARPTPERPLAIAAGQPVELADLSPALLEAAGAAALEEVIIDRELERRCTASGIAMTDTQVAAERALLLATLSDSPDEAERLLPGLRAGRGLGDVRFSRLLRRNAMLRALVGDVQPTAAQVRLLEEARFGPQVRIQVVVFPDDRQATAARQALGPRATTEAVGAVAARQSIDESGPRGGWWGPVSPLDPRVDEGVRRVLERLQPGELSGPVPLRRGVAIVRLDERLPPHQPTDDERTRLREGLVRQVQRERMDMLVRSILAEARPIITDRSLNWSWQQREGGPTPP